MLQLRYSDEHIQFGYPVLLDLASFLTTVLTTSFLIEYLLNLKGLIASIWRHFQPEGHNQMGCLEGYYRFVQIYSGCAIFPSDQTLNWRLYIVATFAPEQGNPRRMRRLIASPNVLHVENCLEQLSSIQVACSTMLFHPFLLSCILSAFEINEVGLVACRTITISSNFYCLAYYLPLRSMEWIWLRRMMSHVAS